MNQRTGGVSLRSAMQVDVFSFGVIIYELLARQVTSAVVSQAGDMTMPEMYAQKVRPMYTMHAAASPLLLSLILSKSAQHSSQQRKQSSSTSQHGFSCGYFVNMICLRSLCWVEASKCFSCLQWCR